MKPAKKSRASAPPPVFGREEILDEAARLLDRTRGGAGTGILLSGPGGVGKTQLLHAIVERARKSGFTVLTGRALPEELPPAFSLLRELLGSEKTPDATASTASGVSRRAGPGAPPSGLDQMLTPTAVTVVAGFGSAREELFARLERGLFERAQKSPMLLAVDDLQFADGSTLDFFLQLSSSLPRAPLAVVATLDESVDVPERNRVALETLSGRPSFLTLPVRPLNAPETEAFVRWLLGNRPPDVEDVRRWHAQTEGNPLFLEQLVRASVGRPGPSGRPTAPVSGVTEMLLDRVPRLRVQERRILTFAAVLGKEFSFSNLVAVAGHKPGNVAKSLDHLVRVGLVREKGGGVYEFVSEPVRQRLYTGLTEAQRTSLHARAGRALVARAGASDSELARHFYLGRDDAKAVEFNLKAAHAATRDYAFLTAVSHVARALEAERRRPDRDPRREIRLLTEEGRLLEQLGELSRSEELLTEAVILGRSEATAELELGRALLGLAQTRATRSEYESAEALATEALERLAKFGTQRDLMAGHRVLGTVAWRRGDFARAERHQRAAVEIAEREGTPLELGHALVDLANTLYPVGATQLYPALDLYRRAAELFETAGEFAARARVLMNQAVAEYHSGRPQDAIRTLTKAIEAADRSRSPIWIGYCNLNLSQWQAELGHPELARPALVRAIEVLGALGNRLGDQQITMTEGMIAEAEGDPTTAEARYRLALTKARELRIAAEISEMLFRLAYLAAQRGDRSEARRWLGQARESGVANFRPDFAAKLEQLERAIGPGP